MRGLFISWLVCIIIVTLKVNISRGCQVDLLVEKRWIVFYAQDWASLDSPTGHAFVSFVREDKNMQQTVVECWGFYPKNGIGLFGYVEGSIRNDLGRQINEGFAVEVSDSDYQKCIAIKNIWDSKKYNLVAQNCISFIDDVASQICNLKVPTSTTLTMPINYIKELKIINSSYKKCSNGSTMFLFDLSGSMNENGTKSNVSKLKQAKNASKTTLNELKNTNSNEIPEVAVLGFSGNCVPDPTILISNFETDLTLVENRIDAMTAGGGTPLAEAITASECKLANHLTQTGQSKGKLIVLSDGQATCQQIRPPGSYNSGQFGQKIITVNANQCGNSNNKIKYYTIGFNIAAGSPAERDLQYLSQISGGKYLNVQSQTQLELAFKKFNRRYIPKPNPSLPNLPTISIDKFGDGVNQINSESFVSALKTFYEFAKQHPEDCNGAYNLALMLEANDFYKNAKANFQKYLTLCPNAPDRQFVENQIVYLEEEFKQYLLFQKEVVKSDLEFLKLHFEKVQNGQSIVLAEEFKGFLKEKGNYYINLPELMGKDTERPFNIICQEVANGLGHCTKAINRSPNTWDRDAAPYLSMIYLNLELLLEIL